MRLLSNWLSNAAKNRDRWACEAGLVMYSSIVYIYNIAYLTRLLHPLMVALERNPLPLLNVYVLRKERVWLSFFLC